MAKTVWYGPHEIEPGSPVHKRLKEEGATFTREPVEFVDPDAVAFDSYESLNVAQLEDLVQLRGLAVEGTGAKGNVLQADLVAALEADDEAGGTLGG